MSAQFQGQGFTHFAVEGENVTITYSRAALTNVPLRDLLAFADWVRQAGPAVVLRRIPSPAERERLMRETAPPGVYPGFLFVDPADEEER